MKGFPTVKTKFLSDTAFESRVSQFSGILRILAIDNRFHNAFSYAGYRTVSLNYIETQEGIVVSVGLMGPGSVRARHQVVASLIPGIFKAEYAIKISP